MKLFTRPPLWGKVQARGEQVAATVYHAGRDLIVWNVSGCRWHRAEWVIQLDALIGSTTKITCRSAGVKSEKGLLEMGDRNAVPVMTKRTICSSMDRP
jgi:hypothetical protein